MTREQLQRKFPNSSEAFIKANLDFAEGVSQGAVVKPFVCPQPLATQKGEAGHAASIPFRVVRITSHRRRLLDFDNLAGGCKYFLDCCKYAQLIPDDNPQEITLEVRQTKVSKNEEEYTLIEITYEQT